MASNGSRTDKYKSDLKLNILSPRPKPSLLTSVSQVITPTRYPPLYTLTHPNHLQGPLHPSSHDVSTSPYYLGKVPDCGSKYMSAEKDINSDMCTTESEVKSEDQEVLYGSAVSNKNACRSSNNGNRANNTNVKNSILNGQDDEEHLLFGLEKQIIVNTIVHTDTKYRSPDITDYTTLNTTVSDTLTGQRRNIAEEDKSSVDGPRMTAQFQPSGCHSHSSSMSGNESISLPSPRCSVCDGCSSTHSSIQALNKHSSALTFGQSLHSGDRSRTCSEQSSFSTDLSDICKQGMHDSCFNEVCKRREHNACTCSGDMTDTGVYHPSVTLTTRQLEPTLECPRQTAHITNCSRQHDPVLRQTTLGNIVVLSMWVQLSKYRELQIENTKQKKSMSDYERKLDSLILTVLVLSKQMKSTLYKLQSVHGQLDQMKMKSMLYKLQTVHGQLDQMKGKQKEHGRKLGRVYIAFGCLVFLYILQISSIRRQCLSLIQYFGLFEMLEKINRTRKVVSENWRNIPSLLTDFWRIFIFRSRSRLRDRFS